MHCFRWKCATSTTEVGRVLQVYLTLLITISYASCSVEETIKMDRRTPEDSAAASDEHHRVIILVPQYSPAPHFSKPMAAVMPQHGKYIPVVHSGKVIHAHHHDGGVKHEHQHVGKGQHEHKHNAVAAHKHTHHAVGIHKHDHHAQGMHSHKHSGNGVHTHKHTGKGFIDHTHTGHAVHDHNHKGHGKLAEKYHSDLPSYQYGTPYVNFGSKLFPSLDASSDGEESDFVRTGASNAVGSMGVSSLFNDGSAIGKLIQIRIPDEHDASLVKEIDIDTDTDIAVMRNKYVDPADDGADGGGIEEYESVSSDPAADYVASFNNEEVADHSADGSADNGGYTFGDGYKLAMAAAEEARLDEQREHTGIQYPRIRSFESGGFKPIVTQSFALPAAYSDSYRY